MTLLQLQYVIECYRLGSFAKAAKNLLTSVSNVSRTVKSLEDELGYSLFVRCAEGATPSPEAIEVGFFQTAERILTDCGNLKTRQIPQARYSFSVSVTPLGAFFEAFYRLAGEYERKGIVNFRMRPYDLIEALDLVSRRNLDLTIISYVPGMGDFVGSLLKERGLCSKLLFSRDLKIYLRKEHPAITESGEVNFAALCDYPIVLRDNERNLKESLNSSLVSLMSPPSWISVPDRVKKGEILTKMNGFTVGIESSRLDDNPGVVSMKLKGCNVHIALVTPDNTVLSAPAVRYLELCREEAEKSGILFEK